jgi:hypothetical protein
MSSEDEDVIVPMKRKKGLKQVRYKSEIIREARTKGENYINWKGNVVVAKKMGENCNCSMKCFERIGEGNVSEIKQRLYSFNTTNEQDAYLQSLISMHEVSRRRQVSDTNPKIYTYTYRVTCTSGKFSLCKKAFCAIHGVT